MSRNGSGNARLSAKAKLDRDRRIVLDRARGLRWQTIANTHGLTPRQCQNIFKEQRAESVTVEDPPSVVDEVLEQLEALIEEAALLGENTTNDACHLGSINARFKIMETKFRVMQAAGLMPSMPDLEREIEGRRLAAFVVKFLEQHLGGHTDWRGLFLSRLEEERQTRARHQLDARKRRATRWNAVERW